MGLCLLAINGVLTQSIPVKPQSVSKFVNDLLEKDKEYSKLTFRNYQIVLWVKVITAELRDLSLILQTHTVEREDRLPPDVLRPPEVCHGTCRNSNKKERNFKVQS